MSTNPMVRDGDAVKAEPVDAAEGLSKAVLLDESDGTPTFALRRFTLAAGASVPRHTNAVEHVQYVLAGEYVVGIEGTDGDDELANGEHRIGPGDSLLIPAGTVHWYRNEGERAGEFLCAVPNGDDAIEVVE